MRNSTQSSPRTTHTTRRDLIRTVAAAVATVFVLVGIAGFIPGLTTNVDDMPFAGHADNAAEQPELLGLFHVSVLHNLVHLAFGIGLLMARTVAGATAFLIGGGVVYGIVAIYGALVDEMSDANFLPVNPADNWLHLGLALGMIGLGLALAPRSNSAAPSDGAEDPTMR